MAENNGKKKVLITGGAGLIGGVLIDRIGDRYELSVIGSERSRRCSIARRLTR